MQLFERYAKKITPPLPMRLAHIQPDAMTTAGRHALVEIATPQTLYKHQGTSSTAQDFMVAINSGATQASNTPASGTFTSKPSPSQPTSMAPAALLTS